MFDRFTDQARRAVVLAQEDARIRDAGEIRTEHLLMGVCRVPEGPAAALLLTRGVTAADLDADVAAIETGSRPDPGALAALGIDLDEVRRQAEEAFGPGALDRTRAAGRRGRRRRNRATWHIPFERAAKKALELSLREAVWLEHHHIGTEHVLLGLLRTEEGSAHRVLAARGVSHADVRAAIADPGAAAG